MATSNTVEKPPSRQDTGGRTQRALAQRSITFPLAASGTQGRLLGQIKIKTRNTRKLFPDVSLTCYQSSRTIVCLFGIKGARKAIGRGRRRMRLQPHPSLGGCPKGCCKMTLFTAFNYQRLRNWFLKGVHRSKRESCHIAHLLGPHVCNFGVRKTKTGHTIYFHC